MVKVREQLDAVFNKEMDRKNFLKYSGGVVLGLLGITGLIRLLLGTHTTVIQEQSKDGGGYGSSRYGQ